MTTGRINQVTGLGPDHDSLRPQRMRVPGLPRSCRKKQLRSATKRERSRRMPSHTSNATPGKLQPERSVATLRGAHQRLHTQHRGTCEPFQFGTDTTPDLAIGMQTELRRIACSNSPKHLLKATAETALNRCSPQPHKT